VFKKENTICFCGHRSEKLPIYLEEMEELQVSIYDEIDKAISEGFDTFIFSACYGFDFIFADMVTLNPNLKGNPQVFELAYYQAKISSLENNAKTAFENGKKSAFDSKNAKQKLNNELGKPKTTDALPDGLTLIPEGDGIFL
jgi:hypothetical protein